LLSTGLIFHQLAIIAEGGLSASLAAQLFIPHAIALATMSVFAGFLVDRLGPKVAFAVGITLLVAAMLLLSSVTVEPMAVAYSLLLGASEGTTRVVNSTVWAHYFGRTNIARLQGSAVMVVICGTALGPLPFALLSGWLGGLAEASAVLCLVALAALAAVLIYRPAASAADPHPSDDRVPLV
jgi:MFS family permease